MISVLERILKWSNYNFVIEEFFLNDEKYLFAASREKNMYLVITKIEEDRLIEFTEENKSLQIVDLIYNLKAYNANVDKNLSLIIAIEVEKLTHIPINQYLDIEENPYYFRKYVIPFTSKQISTFSELISKISDITLISNLKEKVKNTNDFKNYTENPEEDSSYNLLCKLFIKLPFLSIKLDKRDNTQLSKDIKKRLNSSQIEFIEKFSKDIEENSKNEVSIKSKSKGRKK